MQLTFLGAAGTVTGSRHLLETPQSRVLLDCGLHQGGRDAAALNRAPLGFSPRELSGVVLSHAHIDHCGLLPRLWKEGYRGPVYATQATLELATLLLKDSAHLQQADYERHVRRGRRAEPPPYDAADVEGLLELCRPVRFGQWQSLGADVRVRLHEAGHILGASIVEIEAGSGGSTRTLVFSGDLGQPGRPILRDAEKLTHADVVLLESTYGDQIGRAHV